MVKHRDSIKEEECFEKKDDERKGGGGGGKGRSSSEANKKCKDRQRDALTPRV